MTKDEALRLALEALKWSKPHADAELTYQEAITAIKAALEAKDEPVAGQPLPCPFCGHVGLNFADGETYRWGVASCGGCGASCGDIRREYPDLGEWHTEAIAEWNRRSPAPQRTWVALTDEQISDCMEMSIQKTCRAIEAKLKEKNGNA
jgi:hypothetical protein